MTPNLTFFFLSVLGIIVFFMLAISNKDVIISQLFTALSLIACLNTVRLVSGKNSTNNHDDEKSTNT